MRHESSRKPMTNEALAEGGGDDGGEDVWTFDVGFEGDYVEKGLPVGRLAAPKDLGFLGNVEDATNEGDDGTTRDPEEELREMKEGKNNIAVAAAKQLRVVACSLNMSGRSFLPAQGGADAFGKWIAPGGSFESAVLGSSEDTADIIVIALQDAPSEDMGHHGSFRPHKEKIAEQLGVFFHLTAVVQRHRGALQLLVFVRKALIPKEGTEVLSLKSFALGLKADGTFEKECPDGRSQLGGQPYVSTRRIDEACGGLTVQLNIAGTTFRFIACRLVHGQEASTTAIRRDQITKITEAVAKNFDGPIFDCAHHCFLLGDLGCRIDLRESTIGEQEHSALLLELARGGPSGWRRLYQGDDLHLGLVKHHLLQGYVTPDCDQFEPVFDEKCTTWNPHYGTRCLVKSLPSCSDKIICREYRYLQINPTDVITDDNRGGTFPPQLPLRACFHVAVEA
jgi:hypothetical protein